jgi:predicted ABC-type ATPase
MKDVFVLGDPNGAGKTTASNRILPGSIELRRFLNADEIARELSPCDPDSAAVAAGRLLLQGMEECTRSGVSFAFETTCAGRAHLRRLRLCRSVGYRVTLIFLWLPLPEAALARVAQRVAMEAMGFRMTESSGDTQPGFATCGISICRLQMSR